MHSHIYHPVWELPKKPLDSVTTYGPTKEYQPPRTKDGDAKYLFKLLAFHDKTLRAKLEYAFNKHVWPTT